MSKKGSNPPPPLTPESRPSPPPGPPSMERNEKMDDYEDALRRRQKEHLEKIAFRYSKPSTVCLHNGCQECIGTGRKADGTMCVHMISCPCPRCSRRC